MLFKKKLKGFKVKEPANRSRDEISQEYSNHAFEIGHKSRVVAELQTEIDHHISKLRALTAEVQALPPETVAAPAPAEPVSA